MQPLQIKKASHVAYDIRYQFVWSTKYRKPIFVNELAVQIREIIRQVCQEFNVEILSGVVKIDCLKLVVAAPPTVSVSQLVGKIKGKSAITLFRANENLRKIYPAGHLWATGYFASTNIDHADERPFKYIEVEEPELSELY